MESLIKDFQYGFRNLVKRPGYTAIAVITLAASQMLVRKSIRASCTMPPPVRTMNSKET